MSGFLALMLWMVPALTSAAEQDDRGYIVKVGDPCPELTMTLTDGRSVSLKELKGKVVVLQFTASWCSVCRKEMPHLEKEVWQRFKERDFLLVGVDRDEPIDVVKRFARETGVTYPMALDPGSDLFALFARRDAGVTRNVVFDKTGKIVFLTRLFEDNEFQEMIRVIDGLTAAPKSD